MGRQVKKIGKSALSVLLAVCLAIPTSLVFPSKARPRQKILLHLKGCILSVPKSMLLLPE